MNGDQKEQPKSEKTTSNGQTNGNTNDQSKSGNQNKKTKEKQQSTSEFIKDGVTSYVTKKNWISSFFGVRNNFESFVLIKNFKNLIQGFVGQALIALIAAFGIFGLYYAYRIETRRVPRIVEAFEKSHEIQMKSNLVERPEELEKIKNIVNAPTSKEVFYIVIGEHGTGKTTLTKQVVNQIYHDK